MVDDSDFDWACQYEWYIDPQGYVRATYYVFGKLQNMKLHTKLRGKPTSFRDGNKLNCQRDNLIDYVNTGGSGRPRKSDLPKGIYKQGNSYLVHAVRDGKRKYIGSFKTLEEAENAKKDEIPSDQRHSVNQDQQS